MTEIIRGIPVVFIFCVIGLNAHGFPQYTDELQVQEVVRVPTIPLEENESFPPKVFLGPVVAGEIVEKRIILQNRTSRPIVLDGVELACSCIEAKVPRTTLEPGESIGAEFKFKIDRIPKTLSQAFSATLITKGRSNEIVLIFRADIKDYVGFAARNLTRTVDASSGNATIELPILASDPQILKRVSFRTGLPKGRCEVVDSKGVALVKLVCDLATGGPTIGTVDIVVGDKILDTITVELIPKSPVQVYPYVMVFVPVSNGKFVANSNVLVKLSINDQQVSRVVRARCLTSDTSEDLGVQVDISKIRDGLFRANVGLHSRDLLKQGQEIKWEFLTDLGALYSASKVHFSN
jgi:hypothetical protein